MSFRIRLDKSHMNKKRTDQSAVSGRYVRNSYSGLPQGIHSGHSAFEVYRGFYYNTVCKTAAKS